VFRIGLLVELPIIGPVLFVCEAQAVACFLMGKTFPEFTCKAHGNPLTLLPAGI
jgi:hypothetical protein